MNKEYLDELVEELNECAEQCEEYDESEDCCLAEYISDLGYNECQYETKHLTDEARAILENLSAKDARQAVLDCSHVELVNEFYQVNEVFSGHLGEQEHQLDNELSNKITALKPEEFQYLAKHAACYISDTNKDLIYINHGFDRWVLIVDEEKLENWKPNKRNKLRGAK